MTETHENWRDRVVKAFRFAASDVPKKAGEYSLSARERRALAKAKAADLMGLEETSLRTLVSRHGLSASVEEILQESIGDDPS